MPFSIADVTFDDAANYTCVLTNPYGRTESSFQLIVQSMFTCAGACTCNCMHISTCNIYTLEVHLFRQPKALIYNVIYFTV